jgi:hypothetical protein
MGAGKSRIRGQGNQPRGNCQGFWCCHEQRFQKSNGGGLDARQNARPCAKESGLHQGFTGGRNEKQDLPLHFQHTLESAVQEELQAQGIMATAKIVLASRVIDLANKAETPEALETLTRAHKNLAPQVAKDASTTVNVNQQAAAGVQIQSPKDVLAEIVESAREDNAGQ